MTNEDTLVELYKSAKKCSRFNHGNHVALTLEVSFYVDRDCFMTKDDPYEMFFSITAFGFEVRHARNGELMVEGHMKNFSEFDFEYWANKVMASLNKELSIITIDGKKYVPIEEE